MPREHRDKPGEKQLPMPASRIVRALEARSRSREGYGRDAVCCVADPNALVPVTVEVNLRDGRSDTERVDVMYGNPARPMTRVAQLEKFSRNCAAAARPIAPEAAERVIATVARLESLSDVTVLVDDLVPAPTPTTHPPSA